MEIRDYDPALGQAFQGDVSIVPVPTGWDIARTEEIKPVDGRLILQEGEVTGHHHAVHFRDDGLARSGEAAKTAADLTGSVLGAVMAAAQINVHEARANAHRGTIGTARLYRDPVLAQRMVSDGPLTRADLIVGFLVVEGGEVVVRHEEHDGIRLPPGVFCIGRQVESAGAEERRVSD